MTIATDADKFDTGPLGHTLHNSPILSSMQTGAYGLRSDDSQTYHMLPARMLESDVPDSAVCWRIELFFERQNITLGTDLVGDVIIGRGPTADLDLNSFGAADMGVSRQHVLLRPGASALYIVDMDSTNGAQINGTRLGRNEARAVQNGSMIAVGMLPFTLRVIEHTTVGDLRQRGLFGSESDVPGGSAHLAAPQTDDDEDTRLTHRPESMGTTEQVEAWLTARYVSKLKSIDQASAKH